MATEINLSKLLLKQSYTNANNNLQVKYNRKINN